MQRDFDVIIIGGGAAGFAAGIEAARAGASVMILEADKKPGGASAMSGGVFYAAGTSVQRAAGIVDDNADAMFEYIMALNQWALKPDAIFDEPTLVEASNDGRYLDPFNTGMTTPTWAEETIRKQVAAGRIKTADTLADLAAACGINAPALEATVARYNENCAAGGDPEFLKTSPKFFSIIQPPFYAVEIRAAIIGGTGAGLDVDASCRVLDTHGRAIPGLYAAGEVLGVVQGRRDAGGGMYIGSAITLGRLAGQQAAAASRANQPIAA